ncbi:hypothetical protein ScPMuIL_003128 [Solemya velum]
MCGEISMTPVGSSGAQAGVKSKQPPQTKISVTSGDSSGTQAGVVKTGQSLRAKVSAPTSPGLKGAASSKAVTGLKRARTFSVSGLSEYVMLGQTSWKEYRSDHFVLFENPFTY